jgi:hypothetical protein
MMSASRLTPCLGDDALTTLDVAAASRSLGPRLRVSSYFLDESSDAIAVHAWQALSHDLRALVLADKSAILL